MAATPGEVPAWLQDDAEGEDVSLGVGGASSREYRDYTQPRRSLCRRCAPLLICLALAGLAAGLAVYFTGKSPEQLAEVVVGEAEELAEDYIPGYGDGDEEPEKEEHSDEPTEFIFFSPEFEDGDELPAKYMELSPPLSWRNIPEGVESLALIFEEPSDEPGADGQPAPSTIFWVAFDIPIDAAGLDEGLPDAEQVELERADTDEGNGGSDIFMLQGLNSWGEQFYNGEDGADGAPVGSFGYRPPDEDDGDDNEGEVRIFYFRLLALAEKFDGSLDPKFATAAEVRKEAKEMGIVSELSLQVSFQEQ